MNNPQLFRKSIRIFLILGDLISIPLFYFFSYWIRSKSSFLFFDEKMPLDRFYWITHHVGIFVFVHIALIYFHGLYDRFYYLKTSEIISRSIRSVSIEILILVAIYFFRQDVFFPRSILILLWILNSLFTSSWHILLTRLYSGRIPDRNLLIVGTNSSSLGLLKEIQRLPSYGLKIVGFLEDHSETQKDHDFFGFPILGNRDDLLRIVDEFNVQEVVISSEGSWQDALIDRIARLDQISARISIIPTCYEILIGRINHLRIYDIPLIEVIKQPVVPIAKRLADLLIASVLLITSIPVFVMTAALIKSTSKGPIFYRQERYGKNRVVFTILKFRTLIDGAEDICGPVLTSDEDSRITHVGRILRKYRIDELPQLINILRGQMSFVGPRPERPYFVDQFMHSIPGYGERFKALPGLTGLAQVNGGYATTPENKLKYDLAYIYNQSIYLDLRILIETIKVILTGQVSP